ncbi:hypothetical protein [Novosphingobium sp.]|uniref:P-II family nitrogen regulator n=1 Tax=Novosphingobium sp. TaxID=1874826 RepID=UPI0033424E2D
MTTPAASNADFASLTLHRLKKIEIIVHAADQRPVEDLLHVAGIGGWTMIRDVAGVGHSGFHQARSIFNDQTGLVMFLGVGEAPAIARIARGLARLFETLPGVTFLSDVEVMRSDYFARSEPDRV